MKIDIYTHVMPERYKKALYKYSTSLLLKRPCRTGGRH